MAFYRCSSRQANEYANLQRHVLQIAGSCGFQSHTYHGQIVYMSRGKASASSLSNAFEVDDALHALKHCPHVP